MSLILVTFKHTDCSPYSSECGTSNAVDFDISIYSAATVVVDILMSAVKKHLIAAHGGYGRIELTCAWFTWANNTLSCDLLKMDGDTQRKQVQLAISQGQDCTLEVEFED